jgi:hypothetical protein
VALRVLDGESDESLEYDPNGQPSTLQLRRSKEELVQEFWNEISFPTPASQLCERGSPVANLSNARR